MTKSDRVNKRSPGSFDFPRTPLVIITHAAIFSVAYWLAYYLRFDFAVPNEYQDVFWITLPYLLVIQLCCFAAFGAFDVRGDRSAFRDMNRLASPLLLGFLIFALLDFSVLEINIPRSVHMLNLLIAMTLVASFRYIWRISRDAIFPPRLA